MAYLRIRVYMGGTNIICSVNDKLSARMKYSEHQARLFVLFLSSKIRVHNHRTFGRANKERKKKQYTLQNTRDDGMMSSQVKSAYSVDVRSLFTSVSTTCGAVEPSEIAFAAVRADSICPNAVCVCVV